jgi:hypothetical protein
MQPTPACSYDPLSDILGYRLLCHVYSTREHAYTTGSWLLKSRDDHSFSSEWQGPLSPGSHVMSQIVEMTSSHIHLFLSAIKLFVLIFF